MNTHVKIVGILHLLYGLLLLGLSVILVFGLGFAGSMALVNGEQDAAALLGVLGTGLSGFFAVLSLPSLIGGWALLVGKSWGRILVLLLGFLHLIDIPFGTALGIYTIWALLRHDETDTHPNQVTTVAQS